MNVEEKMLEIAPTCHFFMGGVRVDDHWASTFPGIYAAGEAAGGVHGANRLSQNSLADILVSGARAGKYSAQYASGTEMKRIDSLEVMREEEKIQRILDSSGKEGISPRKLKHKIKKVMWDVVSLFRNGNGLKHALEEVDKMGREDLPRLCLSTKTRRFNRELMETLEVENLLMVCESIIRSAILREESRGAHYRSDYPELDNVKWLRHIAVGLKEGKFHLDSKPVDLSQMEPGEVK
jgi:fumarate reductase (CoM/CoB) subunit A